MIKIPVVLGAAVLYASMVSPAMAQRGGRGGGAGRAGGGIAVGSNNMGARPSQSMNRSPSMSRASSPSISRPTPPQRNPNLAGELGGRQPGQSLPPRAGNVGINNNARQTLQSPSNPGSFNSTRSYDRPDSKQLGNFLNMPQPSVNGNLSRSSSPPRATQQPSKPGNSRTITTAGGSTITIGGTSGSGVTAGGKTLGGALGGIKIETAGGETFGKVGGIAGASDGINSAVKGGSIAGASDGRCNSAARVRGGYTDSSGFRQGGSITAAQNRFGYTAATARAGYGNGLGTGEIGAIHEIRSPSGNIISGGRGAGFVNGQFVGGQTWSTVNGNFNHWNYFSPGYISSYPNAWWPGKWAVASTAWATASYAVAGSYCGITSEGTYYDYGQNVTYEDGIVYQDDTPVASSEEYYEQSKQIADDGQNARNEDWMPLGVFAVVADGQTNTDKVAQLALNKDGVIHGNLHDVILNQVTPITGSVDKDTQRVALKLKGNENLIVESGLYNLTNDEVPVLVHFSPEKQETRTLVRLKNPDEPSY